MRTPDIQLRQTLRAALQRGPMSNRELEAAAHVSAATAKRILHELQADLISAGETRRRKHALRRQVRGTLSTIETFAIDAKGRATRSADVELIQPGGCHALLDPLVWPQESRQGGWWEGLPYPFHDMRPQGYLGRIVAQAVGPALNVSAEPDHWSDDDALWFLANIGSDTPGNLIIGEKAMQLWTRTRTQLDAISARALKREYVQRAQSALKQAGAGSSAGGEFPKFTAARSLASASTPHVIVKFSAGDRTGAARRWADLLVCEHLAAQAISAMDGHFAARTRIIEAEGRTFLESERFDRHAEEGRSALVSLSAIEAALVGAGPQPWPAVLRSTAGAPFFEPGVRDRVEELWWFGRFIANSDMHTGNLSFRPKGATFDLAPAYDMLPMRYGPLRGGDVPDPEFAVHDLPMPPRDGQERWSKVLQAAIEFWREAARDSRISAEFRAVCASNANALGQWSQHWG